MLKAIVAAVVVLVSARSFAAVEPVTSGSEIDYQPAVLRSSDDDARIVVFERLDPDTFSGDLWLTRSTDGGATWSEPAAILATGADERHPALVQTGPSAYALFYLKGTGGNSTYRIWRATSGDGATFVEQNQLDLGWATGGEINPHVIRHPDGTLTMSYQRLGGGAGAYVAQSTDGGATWDTATTQIAAGAALPRIAYRASDGLYLASYQVNPGDNALRMYVETTTDVHDWSAAPQDFAIDDNNHDSLPVLMPDDAFVVFWIRSTGGPFQLYSRRSPDGSTWEDARPIAADSGGDNVEPHPLVGASSSVVELYWGRDEPAGSLTYDIVREAEVLVADDLDAIFADGFDV